MTYTVALKLQLLVFALLLSLWTMEMVYTLAY